MKIICKNTQELLNTLYGDKEDYSHITEKEARDIIKLKLESLDKIYDYLEDTDLIGEEQFDLGDCKNLIQLFVNVEFEEE